MASQPSSASEYRPLARLLSIIVFASAALVGSAAAAHADPGTPSTASVESVKSRTVHTDAVESEYGISRSNSSRGADLKSRLVDLSKRAGIYYDAAAVDYLKFTSDGAAGQRVVEMAVPREYRVATLTVLETASQNATGERADGVSAEVEGQIADDAVAYPDGPGFVSWTILGSGQYLLKLSGIGEQLSTWSKMRVGGEADPYYNYIAYKRKAIGTAYDLSWTPDYRLISQGIRAYPTQSGIAHHWYDWGQAPGTYGGDCTTSFPLTVSFGSLSTTISFRACAKYTVSWSGSYPGDMSNNWSGYRTGSTEIAFDFIVAIRAPYTGIYFHDYQRVSFQHPFTESVWSCASTNVNRTCL